MPGESSGCDSSENTQSEVSLISTKIFRRVEKGMKEIVNSPRLKEGSRLHLRNFMR